MKVEYELTYVTCIIIFEASLMLKLLKMKSSGVFLWTRVITLKCQREKRLTSRQNKLKSKSN